jgi:glyoxylase-like metal-dependent hydrolase (beta-lactamase superfamily II)
MLSPVTGDTGPQVMPPALNFSTSSARQSLERLAELDTQLVLPGHGDPWRGSARTLIERLGIKKPSSASRSSSRSTTPRR